jgi:hypothetical protein
MKRLATSASNRSHTQFIRASLLMAAGECHFSPSFSVTRVSFPLFWLPHHSWFISFNGPGTTSTSWRRSWRTRTSTCPDKTLSILLYQETPLPCDCSSTSFTVLMSRCYASVEPGTFHEQLSPESWSWLESMSWQTWPTSPSFRLLRSWNRQPLLR